MNEKREVLVVDCVVNVSRPIIQPDLDNGVERDHKRDRRAELQKIAFRMRVEDYVPESPELNEDALILIRSLWLWLLLCHGIPAI